MATGTGASAHPSSDDGRNEADEGKYEIVNHAELLALPPHESEVHIGGIPYDTSEEELTNFCESVGKVTEVRLFKGKKFCYAFVTFRTEELALKAIELLNDTYFKGRKIRCSTAHGKKKLFIGNIPKDWTEDDMKKAAEEIGVGVMKVELLKDESRPSCNRGYAMIEYYNRACAEYSRNKMSNPEFKLNSNAPTVSWADPKIGDSASASQVKTLYVKNLPKNITRKQFRQVFEHHGKVEEVVLPLARSRYENRFGFVHFAECSTTMKALLNTEKYELDGQVLDCSLAYPEAKRKDDTASNAQEGACLPNYLPAGYGAYGAYGALSAGAPHPTILPVRCASFPGPSLIPVILPGEVQAYVLQQPGAPAPAPQRAEGRLARAGRNQQNADNSRGSRYRPY